MSIKIEKKEGGTCVSWTMDLYSKSVKRILTFKLNSLPNLNISSQVPSYEISWMVKNFPDWEQRGFDPLKSQDIYFRLKKVDASEATKNDSKEKRGVIPDCYLQPQTVWVNVDGGLFQLRFKKITKVILNKVECDSENAKSTESWESPRITFRPLTKERFTLNFFLQFKPLFFSQMNAIIEQTTKYLFLQQTNCDVQFHFNGDSEKIGAHKNILSARSPVFAAMFNHDMTESKTGEVFIEEIERNIFYQLLHYIYSGQSSNPLTLTTAQQLLAAADKYNIQDLVDECTYFLTPYVNEITAQKLFELADQFDVENLKEECERITLQDIRMSNVLDLIIWAHLHSSYKVKEAALNFARLYRKVIFQTTGYEKMMRDYPDICLMATRHMTR